ncbi:UNVERIFIED_CONTAM: LacI family DNA-binding transcriptional regulator, partial [Campylobacter jejuni]
MATIKDVARIAGVSVSTVSHVVNGTRYVSPEKVKKVEDAIRQLDELPNFIAKRSGAQQASGNRSVLLLLSKKNSLFQNQVKEKLEEIL